MHASSPAILNQPLAEFSQEGSSVEKLPAENDFNELLLKPPSSCSLPFLAQKSVSHSESPCL